MKISNVYDFALIPLKVHLVFVTCVLCLSSCDKTSAQQLDQCAPKLYFQQMLYTYADPNPNAGGAPSLLSNSFTLPVNLDNGWIVEGFVRVEAPIYHAPPTLKYDEINLKTTFLIVGVDDPESYKFSFEKYFDGEFSEVGYLKDCPIYYGLRDGKYALATLRKRGELESKEIRIECNIAATLTFFGFKKEDLNKHSSFTSLFMGVREEYNPDNIRTYLNYTQNCGHKTF